MLVVELSIYIGSIHCSAELVIVGAIEGEPVSEVGNTVGEGMVGLELGMPTEDVSVVGNMVGITVAVAEEGAGVIVGAGLIVGAVVGSGAPDSKQVKN